MTRPEPSEPALIDVRLFAAARQAAGTGHDRLPGATVAAVLAEASARYGPEFDAVLATSRVWVNGEAAGPGEVVRPGDELAVLPPVSGGAAEAPAKLRPRPRPRKTAAGSGKAPSRPGRFHLFPEPDTTGHPVILGLVWATGTMAATLAAPLVLALWMAPVAAAAAAQACRTWSRAPRRRRPVPAAAFGAAGVMALGAAFGPVPFIVVSVLALVGAAAWAVAKGRAGPVDVGITVVAAALAGGTVAGPVLLRDHGLVAALVLVTYALAYDVGSWVMASGARFRWVGPVAGIVCIAPLVVGVASIFSQFHGDSAWVLGVVAAATAPIGQAVAYLALGDRGARVPAIRRLDCLVVLGPVWAISAARLGV
jgi:molybdopterin synthase sulfur carrier subunit